MAWFGKKSRKNRVLVLLDLENLFLNFDVPSAERFSIMDELDKLMRQLGTVGEITAVFAFASPQTVSMHLETLFRQGFYPIPCPKIKNKAGQETDTVDSTLMDFGKKMFGQMVGLTHFCLGSGDKDFNPLLREAIRHGLKIMIVAGNLTSLARELIGLTDENPDTHRKMVYILSPMKGQPSSS